MKRLRVVSDRGPFNGMFVAAKLIADHEGLGVVTCGEFATRAGIGDFNEVVVHGCWLSGYWKACLKILRARMGTDKPRLVRMTHGNLDPVRLNYHGWKKRIVAPIERWLVTRTDRVLVTCSAEQGWCESWGVKGPYELVDQKQFSDLTGQYKGKKKDPVPSSPVTSPISSSSVC